MFCTCDFKDLQETSGLLSCGHRVHLPCMATYIAKTLLKKARQKDNPGPTCPMCRAKIAFE